MNQPPDGQDNLTEYSVSELSGALKRSLETGFGRIRVRGEISGLRQPRSGHLYFDLKDERAVLASVCWKQIIPRLPTRPEDGLEILATGRVSTYSPQSKYQLMVENFELAGQGALLKLLEERKRRLAAEGLFDPARKQPLPFLPRILGIITSPTGAVIHDILHRLADRFPSRVILWPVSVQGDEAAGEIAEAIQGFNTLSQSGSIPRPDIILVARGGGSLEDLMAFNDEQVVRAAAQSTIPLISAVGHETDTTLIDYAADYRAPTPSAAAEIAVPVRRELQASLEDRTRRLTAGIQQNLATFHLHMQVLSQKIPPSSRLFEKSALWLDEKSDILDNALKTRFMDAKTRLDYYHARLRPVTLRENQAWQYQKTTDLAHRMQTALKTRFLDAKTRLDHHHTRLRPSILSENQAWQYQKTTDLAHRMQTALKTRITAQFQGLKAISHLLTSYSYHHVLARGYAVIRDSNSRPLTSASQAKAGMAIQIEFAKATPIPAHIDPPSRKQKSPSCSSKIRKYPQGNQGQLL